MVCMGAWVCPSRRRFTSEKATVYAYGRVVAGTRSYCDPSADSCQRDPKCLKLGMAACYLGKFEMVLELRQGLGAECTTEARNRQFRCNVDIKYQQ